MSKNSPIPGVVNLQGDPYIKPTNTPISKDADFGGGGGGGGGGPMEPNLSMKDYVDSRGEAIESRLAGKLDKLPSIGQLWAAVAAIAGAIFTGVAIILTTLSFGSDRFNGGMSVSPELAKLQQTQAEVDKNQDAKAALASEKLDLIIQQTADK